MLADFADTAKSSATIKPAGAKTIQVTGWDIDVLAEGAFDIANVTFAP